MRQGRGYRRPGAAIVLLLLAVAGCGETGSEPSPTPAERPEPVSLFDPGKASDLRGVVTWDGAQPEVPLFQARINLSPDGVTHERLNRQNPSAPVIDPRTKGVASAVVFLRGVDPRRARPWDHPPVRVDLEDYRCIVRQGSVRSTVGFVRRGDAIEISSRQPVFHSLQARGAAFFALTFPDTDHVRSRALPEKGLVELMSGAGYYWMRGYLFVDDHPYYARTDTEGRFVLPQVAPGEYELVCWLPNWKEARHERDPETGLVTHLLFRAPAEQVRRVTVAAGGRAPEVSFHVSGQDFP